MLLYLNCFVQISIKPIISCKMLDCSGGINQGCTGGSVVYLLLWLVENNITVYKEENYPTIYKDQMCTLDKCVNAIKSMNNKIK